MKDLVDKALMTTSQKVFRSKTPRFTLASDLILTTATWRQIEECITLLKYHHKIYIEWNFASVDQRGATAIVNFYGPPGTGKTLAAEALAGTLGMPFLQVDIVDLESSLKGQMSKNVQEVFRSAFEDQALLFFDEADSLLGRRIAVSQGIDSDMNATRSTIMTELNVHRGLVIFATNFPRDYDKAISSRITHQVRFELPDAEARCRLWDRAIVPGIPLVLERAALIAQSADLSEGMSGREIINCMRRALPKALLEADAEQIEPRLDLRHIADTIAQLRAGADGCGDLVKASGVDQEAPGAIKRVLGLQ
jgi:AAA+ superfamily predicted ATPase